MIISIEPVHDTAAWGQRVNNPFLQRYSPRAEYFDALAAHAIALELLSWEVSRDAH